MTKMTVTHSVQVYVHGNDTPLEVTDATAALTVLEQFKQGITLKIPVSGEDESVCFMYVPYHAVIAVLDCPTTETTEVEDANCQEMTPASDDNNG